MSEYITKIPNLEKGKVYTINVSDPESAVNAVKELVYRLCVTFGTYVGYIGLNEHIDLYAFSAYTSARPKAARMVAESNFGTKIVSAKTHSDMRTRSNTIINKMFSCPKDNHFLKKNG